ncbi:MAG: hypothetical protein M1831_001090 [Alyxoria varia]|nr:MAG: hypothetical protein M1831_001090 [Alyxoria varia]
MAAFYSAQPTLINTKPPHFIPNTTYPVQQPSPDSSASSNGTSSTSSPSSTRNNLHSGHASQLRPLKAPIYTPAVLRPTDPPSRVGSPKKTKSKTQFGAPPLTPPSSTSHSCDEEDDLVGEDGIVRRVLGHGPARSGIARIVTDEWNEDAMEDVTGGPTRDHWKPDAASPTCNAPQCDTSFNLIHRRHHCRRCGNIFCAPHTSYSVPLDQHARFHPDGSHARACTSCKADYRAWERVRRLKKKDRQNASVDESGADSGEHRMDTQISMEHKKVASISERPYEPEPQPEVAEKTDRSSSANMNRKGRGNGEVFAVGSLGWSTF